jgi:hypothetical protein
MERAALAIFDDVVPVQYALRPMRYVVEGRDFFVLTLLGYGLGPEIFRTFNSAPETKTRKRKASPDLILIKPPASGGRCCRTTKTAFQIPTAIR